MQPIFVSLGWALFHSLWQIALIYLLLQIAVFSFYNSPRTRYNLAVLAQLAAVFWFLTTWHAEFYSALGQKESLDLVQHFPVSPTMHDSDPVPELAASGRIYFDRQDYTRFIPWLAYGWLAGILIGFFKLAAGYRLARQLRVADLACVPAEWQQKCEHWRVKFNIRRPVALWLSSQLQSPVTLGFWKPVILFPVAAINSLTPVQVEALLIHELAHVRRWDYLINFLQLLFQVVFFYHPLFYQLNKTARKEREYCCDDLVTSVFANNLLYAQALTFLKLNEKMAQSFVLPAAASSAFSKRIFRITGAQHNPRPLAEVNWIFILFVPLVLVSILTPHRGKKSDGALALAMPSGQSIAQATSALKPAGILQRLPAQDSLEPVQLASKNNLAAVAVAPTKMNVLYIGVDNPLRIAAENIPASELWVALEGEGVVMGQAPDVVVQVKKPGTVAVQVYRKFPGGKMELLSTEVFRVKRIPDPVPLFGNLQKTSVVSLEDLANAGELKALLQNFEFDARCEVAGFLLTILGPSEAVQFQVAGGTISDNIRSKIQESNTTALFFDEIKVRCPGDAAARNVGSLAFKVK